MKIQYLEIKNYKQFSDLKLDLTYPIGHEKAGEPLDKICIIGQSGTGKTNLLDIIKKSTIDFSEQSKNDYLPFSAFVGEDTDDRYITTKFRTQKKFHAETLFTKETSEIVFSTEFGTTKKPNVLENEKNYFVSTIRDTVLDKEVINDEFNFDENKMNSSDKKLYDKLVSAKAELVLESINKDKSSVYNATLEAARFATSGLSSAYGLYDRKKTLKEKKIELNKAISDIEAKYTSVSQSLKQLKRNNFLDKHIVNINDERDNLWATMKEKIDNHAKNKDKYILEKSNKILNSEDKYGKKEFREDVEAWELENENLLEKIADNLNFILNNFNLELTKIDENQHSYNGLIIKDLSNNSIIEYDDLSTGTKNLLSTFIPLKTYAPKDSIILIDEPEMSFYPDIQRKLTDLYMNVGSNNQLVLATHSPLVASNFEPWEVVELKFDENNQIYRDTYYEGENHVDNYTVDPRMLTWTGILTDVFDLKNDSNFDFREGMLMDYASLKAQIVAIDDEDEKENKIKELMKLSKLLGLQN